LSTIVDRNQEPRCGLKLSVVEDYGQQVTLHVARRFKELRLERRWTLEAVARESGLHRSAISLVENGKRGVTVAAATRLARALGVRLSDLIRDAEDA
jgi:DNA-binding XRE family transcriptional regulator